MPTAVMASRSIFTNPNPFLLVEGVILEFVNEGVMGNGVAEKSILVGILDLCAWKGGKYLVPEVVADTVDLDYVQKNAPSLASFKS